MAVQFYVGRNNKQFGPFSVTQVRELAATHRLRAGDTLWKEGMAAPVLVSRLKNLFPLQPPALEASTPPEVLLAPSPDEATSSESDVESEFVDQGLAPLTSTPWSSPEMAEVDKPVAIEKPPAPPPVKVHLRRAVGLKGVVIISQDGQSVSYRKKCTQCGHEDASRSSMVIGNGMTRSHFYCPKCRKSREVQIQGMMQ